MKKPIFLLILCLIACRLTSQSAASTQIETALIKASNLSFQNLDSALYLANQALASAQSVDSPRLIFKAQRAIGMINEDNNHLKEAQTAYKLALDIANNQLKEDEQLTIYTDWAIIHKKLGQYDIARAYHLLTIERAEKTGNWEMIEDGYHGLGTLYSMMSDFNQSIQYYLLSIQAAEKWDNKGGIVLSHQNISNIYMKAQNYEMALKNIQKTLELAKELGDSVRIASVLKIYGNINMSMGNLPQALEKHQLAKAIFDENSNKPRLAESYLAIADIYLKLQDTTTAEEYYSLCSTLLSFLPNYSYAQYYYGIGKLSQARQELNVAILSFNECLNLTETFGFKELARDSHMALSEIYTQKNQLDKALSHITEANKISEVLFQEDKQKNMTEAQFKFDVKQRDIEIDNQKQAFDNQKRALTQSRWIWSIFALLSLALLILLYFSWQQVKAKQMANKNIKLLLKELHHRVKNNMQTIASMMRLQARQCQDPSVSAVLMENKSRLETFALLHQQLYKDDKNVETVNLQSFIESMIDKLRFSYGLDEHQLKTNVWVINKELNVEIALSVGLMLNELLTNSLKYAYPSLKKSQPLEITISLMKNQFHYSDNGKVLNIDYDFNSKSGFGIQCIASFAQQIKSKYKFYVENGVHFDLVFPTHV